MRVVVGPVVVDDRICRIVSAIASLLEVEEWVGSWWEPSAIPLTRVHVAPQADAPLLAARGVPPDEWTYVHTGSECLDLEALMQTNDPAREATQLLEDVVVALPPQRQRLYPGNVRFGLPEDATDGSGRPSRRRTSRATPMQPRDTGTVPDGDA